MKMRRQTSENGYSFFTLAILIMLLVTSFLVSSCKNNEERDSETTVTIQPSTQSEKNNSKEINDEFLLAAALINLEEIELGKLAQTKAQSQEVKDLGKMMVEGHTKSLRELTTLAKSKQITIPQQISEDAKEKYRNLNETSGKDFDIKYVDEMIKGHQDAISKFESAQTDINDEDIKAWISATLPDLNMHLDDAKTLDEKIK